MRAAVGLADNGLHAAADRTRRRNGRQPPGAQGLAAAV
jgi:hypothetical protein